MSNQLLEQLRQPFPICDISWKPGAMTKDGTKALGMAYADPRAYQNRLDDVCGLDWAVTYTPWGDRIICNLTINGVTRSSTGEADQQSERSEIAGTAAEAQAFKRACSMFGLGRYLYELPAVWAEFDKDNRKFTPAGIAKLESSLLGKPAPAAKATTTTSAQPPTFSSVDEALNWGVKQGVFSDPSLAKIAYEELKSAKQPKKSSEMFSYWIGEIQQRKTQSGQGKMS